MVKARTVIAKYCPFFFNIKHYKDPDNSSIDFKISRIECHPLSTPEVLPPTLNPLLNINHHAATDKLPSTLSPTLSLTFLSLPLCLSDIIEIGNKESSMVYNYQSVQSVHRLLLTHHFWFLQYYTIFHVLSCDTQYHVYHL